MSDGSDRSHLWPSLRSGYRIYAIGDIHGRFDRLVDLIRRIQADLDRFPVGQAEIIFLGDYISRGPASAEVLEFLSDSARELPVPITLLKGNHEDALLRFLAGDLYVGRTWLSYGGRAVPPSYGLKAVGAEPCDDELIELTQLLAAAIPRSHRTLLESLNLWAERDDYLFVHAGLRPGKPLSAQTGQDLMWIRDEFLPYDGPFEKYLVHGHTPVALPDIRHNRLNVDTKAFESSILTSAVLQAAERRFLATV
jgi:serine/threonine protein phosphatase 1